ncbi:MAG: hypothetical protein ACK6DA_01160 [Candidatus Kapaibacterium sp.]
MTKILEKIKEPDGYKHSLRWSKTDEAELKEAWEAMRPTHEDLDDFDELMAVKLGRTVCAIKWRRHALGITLFTRNMDKNGAVGSGEIVNLDFSTFTNELIEIAFRYEKQNEKIVRQMIESMMDQMHSAFTKVAPGTTITVNLEG